MPQDAPTLNCAGRLLDLSRPIVMGIINTTPDSFADGGTLYKSGRLDLDLALRRAADMVTEGALILDVGGESTRPGAKPITLSEERDRVLPLLERISAEFDVVTSVDTSSPQLMSEASSAGAGLLNDVRALTREGALAAAKESNLPICLMHMQGEPGTMQMAPEYADVVSDVREFLLGRVAACEQHGIVRERLILDPGFGFGKSVAHNMQLLRGLPLLVASGFPVLVGLSRKSMIGKLLGRDVEQRMPASIALAVLAVQRGATIIRTHDVQATSDAVAMWSALEDLGRHE